MPRNSAVTHPFALPTELVTAIASLLSTLELIRTFVVCRRWHSLLTTTPSLWQRLIVNFEAYPRTPLTRLVGYSRGLALELSLMDINEQHFKEVVKVLGDNMQRIRVLKIFFGEWDDVEDQMQDFVDGMLWPAPLLQVFEIGYHGDRNAYIWLRKDVFSGHAPALRHVTLDISFWSNAPCSAFGDVPSLCINPTGWTIHEIMHRFPRLQDLVFCGTWAPFRGAAARSDNSEDSDDSHDSHDSHDSDESDEESFGGLRSLSLSLGCCQEADIEGEVLSFVSGANSAGVERLDLRVDRWHQTAAKEFFQLPVTVYALCIARGGQEPGLQWRFSPGVGVYIELTDPERCVFTVGHSEVAKDEPLCGDDDASPDGSDSDDSDSAEVEHNHPARSLLRTLQHVHFADIVIFTLCESMFCYVDWYLSPLELRQLQTFTILVIPRARRNSLALFDCMKGAAQPEAPFMNAPFLASLRLACHPRLPAWSVGFVGTEFQEEAVFEEPREVTARSVHDFISNLLLFIGPRLDEIVLESGVQLSEGCCSDAANELRKLTNDLRYD